MTPFLSPFIYKNSGYRDRRFSLLLFFHGATGLTIINKSKELMQLMENAPYDFCWIILRRN
jgi:hypothetical protein